MAKNKNNKKDGKVTAGDLFDKLKPKNNAGEKDSALFERSSEEEMSGNGFSIDVSSGGESDSELDINELLRKYMPDYGSDDEDSAAESGGSVLSKLKRTAAELPEDDDANLISALDSAFGPEEDEENAVFAFEDNGEDPSFADEFSAFDASEDEMMAAGGKKERKKKKEKTKEKKPFLFFGRKKLESDEEDFSAFEGVSSFDDGPAEDAAVEDDSFAVFEDVTAVDDTSALDEAASIAEELGFSPSAMSSDDVNSETTDLRFGDISELDSLLNDPQPVNISTPEMRKQKQSDDDLLQKLAELEIADSAPETAIFEPEEETAAAEEIPAADEMPIFGGEPAFDEIPAFAEETVVHEDEAEKILPEEESVSPYELPPAGENPAREDSDIDPTDLNLRVAFGLDSEAHEAGSEAVKQFGDQLEAKQYKHEKRVKLDRPEFVDKTQIPKIRKEFKNRLVSLWIKLGLSLVFAIALLVFENVTFFTELFTGMAMQWGGWADPAVYPVVYIMVSLQLMLFACLCAYEQILDGFKHIFRGAPKAESMLSFLFVMAVVYSAVLARVISAPTEPMMFNFAVALGAVLSLVYSIYNTKRENMNFAIVASKKPKHIVRCLPDEDARCETQAFMEQTDACDVMKIEKTDFIDGFFGRLNKPDSTVTVYMTFLMSISAALAVLVGFFVGFRGGNAAEILSSGFIALLIGAPLSVLVAFSYPFYRATLAAKEYDSAIIGEASLSEYSNASIISFDDKNVFPSYSVKIQNIKIYNNARVDRVLYYAASVFAYAGGPLQDVFEVTTLDMGHSEDVKIFDTEAGFLATQVNGVNIIFGSYKTLTAKGFDIPAENAADDVDFSSELSIMYMFREDKLVAKMYIKYVMDGDIDLILKQFQGTGLYVCVRTFDPNIDERMIAKKLNMRRIPLKVVRYASAEEVTMYEEKVDSGLVTNASPKSLLQIISYCDKVLHTRKASIALSVLSVIIGIALMGLMILSDTTGIVNSLFLALYHLVWVIPAVIAAKMFIR